MAKLKGPLLSLDAHGSIGKVLSYSRRRSGSQTRKYNKPTGPPSASQQAHRRLNEFATIQWQCMSAGDKATWAAAARASGLALPGYHYFLRQALRDPYNVMDLVGYWPMNQIVANKIQDFSGNGLDFNLKPTPPSDAPKLGTSLQDKFGRSLFFDGINDLCIADYQAPFDILLKLYLEVWIDFTVGTDMILIQQWYQDPDIDAKYFWSVTQHGKLETYLDTEAGQQLLLSWGVMTSGKHMVSFRWDGAVMNHFVDGVQDAGTESIAAPASHSLNEVWIGNYFGGTNWFSGLMAQFCMYRRAPSNAEILKRYQYAIRNV